MMPKYDFISQFRRENAINFDDADLEAEEKKLEEKEKASQLSDSPPRCS